MSIQTFTIANKRKIYVKFIFCIRSKIHRAIIKQQNILSLVGDQLSIGQRVFISGDLRSKHFVNNENQNRQQFHIHVNDLYASKSDATNLDKGQTDAKKHNDCNSIFLLSHIVSDIQHMEGFSRFFLASHLTVR